MPKTTTTENSSLVCLPRWATQRTPGRLTLGGAASAAAIAIRQPLMPWQQLVADVGLEYEIVDGIVVPFYREVVVTVPRQNGKTTLVLVFEVQRAVGWNEPQRIAYTAQTGRMPARNC